MACWIALGTEGLDIWEQTCAHACSLEARDRPAFLKRSRKSLLCGDCSCLWKLLRQALLGALSIEIHSTSIKYREKESGRQMTWIIYNNINYVICDL